MPDERRRGGPSRRPERQGGPRPRPGAPGERGSSGQGAFEIEVTANRWLPRGEAVVDADRPLVIWNGIPGERARVRVVHRGRNQAQALWVEAPEPDPHRRAPPCDRVHLCGGCPLMHLDPAGQELARRALMGDALREVGLDDVPVGAFHPCPTGEGGFRYVIKLGVGTSDRGSLRVGAWGRRSRQVVPIPECLVTTDTLRQAMKVLAHHVIQQELWPYEPETDRGVLRSVVLRESRTTGEVLVTLVAGRFVPGLKALAEALAADLNAVAGVWVHLNSGPGNAIFVRDDEGVVGVRPLIGKETIDESILGIDYRIGPGDFFQTNPATAEVLYGRALARLALAEGDAVVDLYCGVGGFALQAARQSGWALGVEEVDGAVSRARETARRLRIPAEFASGRVVDVLAGLAARLGDARPIVVVNPARRGLEEGVADAILALKPRRIAYVSCNPRALARDLVQFRDAGFSIGEIELFDMFPQTAHVEALTVLDAADADQDAGRRAPRRRVVRKG
jgi:23S rRNA (uracil1939-C5)-methyltransferase